MDDTSSTFHHLQQLEHYRSEIVRLEMEIQQAAARAPRRLELQRELEAVLVSHAALDEEWRVQTTIQKALQHKLVESPHLHRNIGTCPLCLEDVKEFVFPDENRYGRFFCCGTACCYQCFGNYESSFNAPTCYAAYVTSENTVTLERTDLCPICGDDYRSKQATYSTTLLRHAKGGSAWAQLELAHCFVFGKGVRADRSKAKKWFKMAVHQGHIPSIGSYGCFLAMGDPRNGVPMALQEAKPYLLKAARQGFARAQFIYGGVLQADMEEFYRQWEEHVMWVVLAAAQGNSPAQEAIGSLCYEGDFGVHQSDYAAMYWWRKVATKGFEHNGIRLADCVLHAKGNLFGVPNHVGFNAVPEAVFWVNSVEAEVIMGVTTDMCTGRPFNLPLLDVMFEYCGCCGKQASSGVSLRKCARCKGIVYCSKTCQILHWKRGHKIDCNSVDQFRLEMEKVKGVRNVC